MTLDKAREDIEEAIRRDGEYSHNVISCVLRIVANEYGYDVANSLVGEFELEELYGIYPHKGQDDMRG